MADPNAPQHSEGYGPAEMADDTRQAQQTVSNDAPTDVNMNAVIARTQAGTFTLIGGEFAAAAARRTIIADKIGIVA